MASRGICALLVVAICWKYRLQIYSFLRLFAKERGRRFCRQIYFNFWFAAEGLGANNLSTSTKIGVFGTLVAIGYLRIRDRGTFDFPFHGRPRVRQDDSRFRKMIRLLSFYTRETGYWAVFDTYQTAIGILFLAGWAMYLLMVAGSIVVSLSLYEQIRGEPFMNSAFVTDRIQPLIEGDCDILDIFRRDIGE